MEDVRNIDRLHLNTSLVIELTTKG
jgi:hypothetical protein